VCNSCEKSKLIYHRKLQGLPVKKPKSKKKIVRKIKKGNVQSISPELLAPGDDITTAFDDDVLGGIGLDGSDNTLGTTIGTHDADSLIDPRFPSLDLDDLHDLLEDFDEEDDGTLEPELVLRSPHPTSESPIKSRKRDRDVSSTTATTQEEPSRIDAPGTSDIPRDQVIHLNVKLNTESFAVVPVNRDFDKLDYVRKYIEQRCIHELDHRNFTFLTKEGHEVKREDEFELNAWQNTTAKDWTHHTFDNTYRRYHLFVQVKVSDESSMKRRRKAPRAGGDDDDDDEEESKRDQDIVELFKNSSESVQEKLAWQFFSKYHGNINTRGHKTVLGAACAALDVSFVRRLLSLGANINSRDSNGDTCLHIASRAGHLNMLQLLLRAPVCSKTVALCGFATLMALNREGKTPIDVAKDDKTRKFLRKMAFSFQTMPCSNLPDKIHGLSKLTDVRSAMIEMFGILELRFCVQGTLLRISQEKDFNFEQCDSTTDVQGKRYFSFVAVGDFMCNDDVAEKKEEEIVSQKSTDDIASLTNAFLNKMVLDKSMATSCPAQFPVRFRPPQKIRRHIAMAASASPKQHSGRMFFERMKPLHGGKKTRVPKIDEVVEIENENQLSKPIPLRRTISLPSSKHMSSAMKIGGSGSSTSSSTSSSKKRNDGPSSRRVRSDRQFRSSASSNSSGGFFGVFKTMLCMHEKSDTM